MPLFALSDDELLRICSFLWFNDLFAVSGTCTRIRRIFNTTYIDARSSCVGTHDAATAPVNELRYSTLIQGLLCNYIKRSGAEACGEDRVFTDEFTLQQAAQIAARMACWPTNADLVYIRNGQFSAGSLQIVDPAHAGCSSSGTEILIAYRGGRTGENRCYVADNHFPVMFNCHFEAQIKQQQEWQLRQKLDVISGKPDPAPLITPSEVPFTKIIFDVVKQRSIPVLSGIAYFEVTIYAPLPPPHIGRIREGFSDFYLPCVAIGIGNPLFKLQGRMPGWDDYSMGFHGDDGLFFHGSSATGTPCTRRTVDARFGTGDTVGFGIIYSALASKAHAVGALSDGGTHVLFTKNGKLLSVMPILQDSEPFESHTWFPVVGTDCYNPIAMNFGNKQKGFAFDVVAFENSTLRGQPPSTLDLNDSNSTAVDNDGAAATSPWNDMLLAGSLPVPRWRHYLFRNCYTSYRARYPLPTYSTERQRLQQLCEEFPTASLFNTLEMRVAANIPRIPRYDMRGLARLNYADLMQQMVDHVASENSSDDSDYVDDISVEDDSEQESISLVNDGYADDEKRSNDSEEYSESANIGQERRSGISDGSASSEPPPSAAEDTA